LHGAASAQLPVKGAFSATANSWMIGRRLGIRSHLQRNRCILLLVMATWLARAEAAGGNHSFLASN